MTANILINNYYYRYRQQRKNCKSLVDAQNYTQARTQLQNMIAEHIQKYPDSATKRDFNYGEKLIIQHALNHINATIRKNDPPFIDHTGELKHQSDIVKSALVEVPDQTYST